VIEGGELDSVLEYKLKAVFDEVVSLTQGKIVNANISKTRYPTVRGLLNILNAIHIAVVINMAPFFLLYILSRASYLVSSSASGDGIDMLLAYSRLIESIKKIIAAYVLLMLFVIRTMSSFKSLLTLPMRLGGELGYKFFLTANQKMQFDLDVKFSQIQRPSFCHKPTDFIRVALSSFDNQSYDCFGVTGLSILMLLLKNIEASVEIFYPTGEGNLLIGHAYCVLNKEDSSERNISRWNDDAFIFDPWYELLISVKEIKQSNNFLEKYPLLSIENKRSCRFLLDRSCLDATTSNFADHFKKEWRWV
jgi:hypothetical protein